MNMIGENTTPLLKVPKNGGELGEDSEIGGQSVNFSSLKQLVAKVMMYLL